MQNGGQRAKTAALIATNYLQPTHRVVRVTSWPIVAGTLVRELEDNQLYNKDRNLRVRGSGSIIPTAGSSHNGLTEIPMPADSPSPAGYSSSR